VFIRNLNVSQFKIIQIHRCSLGDMVLDLKGVASPLIFMGKYAYNCSSCLNTHSCINMVKIIDGDIVHCNLVIRIINSNSKTTEMYILNSVVAELYCKISFFAHDNVLASYVLLLRKTIKYKIITKIACL